MAKETKITKQQLDKLIELGLVEPWNSQKRGDILSIMKRELYNATRKEDGVRVHKLSEYIRELEEIQKIEVKVEDLKKERDKARRKNDMETVVSITKQIKDLSASRNTSYDNLVFVRYQHPQSMALLLSQSDDKSEPMSMGYLYAPGEEGFVLDLGRTITISGGDDAIEQKCSFGYGEIFATSESAAKNWRVDTKNAMFEEIDMEDISEEEKLQKKKITEEYIENVAIFVPKIVEMDEAAIEATYQQKGKGKKKKTPKIGVGQFAFQFEEQVVEVSKTREIEVVNDAKKESVFDCVLGTWEGEEATMDDVVVFKKIVPTGEFIFDVELVFYNQVKTWKVPVKDENDILVRNEDGTIKEETKCEKTPLIDCRIYAYESVIDIEEPYVFDKETLAILREIQVESRSLVALENEDGVYLHSLNTYFENGEFEDRKQYVLDNKKQNGVKKGEINKIVSFAEFMQFCSNRAIACN